MSDGTTTAAQRWLVDEVAVRLGVSASEVRRYVVLGHVTIGGQVVDDPAATVNQGDIVAFTMPLSGHRATWAAGQDALVVWHQ